MKSIRFYPRSKNYHSLSDCRWPRLRWIISSKRLAFQPAIHLRFSAITRYRLARLCNGPCFDWCDCRSDFRNFSLFPIRIYPLIAAVMSLEWAFLKLLHVYIKIAAWVIANFCVVSFQYFYRKTQYLINWDASILWIKIYLLICQLC